MSSVRVSVAVCFIAAFFASGSRASAQTVSVNFVGGGTAMAPAESAGVVPRPNWNNATGATNSAGLALIDETGAPSSATVTWTSNNTWSTPITDQAGNRRLMKGYLDTTNTSVTRVTVAALPLATYDIYVYVDGDNLAETRTGAYGISGPGIASTSINLTDSASTNFNTNFTQANNSAGNYVKFSSITATGFTLTATPGSSSTATRRAPVNGLQIVPTTPPAPGFTLASTPASGSVAQGAATTFSIAIGSVGGFADPVDLAVSGVPANTTVGFAPMTVSGSGSATLTVTTNATTPTGTSTLTITGTSPSQTQTNTVSLTVTPPSDFTIAVSPNAQTAVQGSSTTYTVTIGATSGFSGVTTFGITGLPGGATAVFVPASVSGSGTSTLTVSAAANTPTGSSTLTVTGTSGALTHSASLGLTVTAPPAGAPAGTISVNFVGSGTAMATTESAGVMAATSWNNATGAAQSTPLSLVNQVGAATGATLTWTSSSTASLPVTDQPGSRRMMRGYLNTTSRSVTTVTVAGLPVAAYDVYLYADGDNGTDARTASYAISGSGITTQSITLIDASNANFNSTFTQAQNSSGNYVKFSVNAGGFTITATPIAGGTKRAPVNGLQIVPTAPAALDFAIAATPASRTIGQASTTTYTVTVSAIGGYSNAVVLGATGLPADASAIFNPASVAGSGSSVLTVSTSITTPLGSSTLTISGSDGSLTHSATVGLTVAAFSITGTITPASVGAGATVNLGGAVAAATTANASGVFTFSGIQNGAYSIVPQKTGVTFTPTSRTVTVSDANVTAVNFTGQVPTYSISGTITPVAGGAGAQLSLTGSSNKTTTADASGNFTFTAVPNGTYSLSPSLSGYTFTPASTSVPVADANVSGISFVASPSTDPQPVGPSGPWTLTFRDEFDGTILDRNVWGTTYPAGERTNNDELEWYTDDDTTHVVSNGTLKLVAYKQSSQGGYPYTSGMISSHNSFNQMYGYFEARMKLPSGAGLWPAFWLLPVPFNWPPEIDVMENLGQSCSTLYLSNHWSSAWPNGVGEPQGGSSTVAYTGTNYCSGFHTYGVEWTSSTIDFYVDGVRRARITDHVPVANPVFSGMHLIANLAVGGSWPGAPTSSTPFPSALEIDYVRVWKR
jgi:beta-glucanase (GH16 family)